jgi:phosphoserine phosphatase
MVRPGMTHILTLIARRDATTLTQGLISAARDAAGGGTVTILSEAEAIDIACPTRPNLDRIRSTLGDAPIDAIATEAEGRRKRLLIADMDSTIIVGETLDDLAAHAGIGEQIAAITKRAMNGELDFKAALRERVGMLKGLSVDALEQTWRGTRLTGGARELVATMRTHGAFTALVSGGFTFFTGRVAALVGFDLHRSNELLHDGATLAGAVGEPILDRTAKALTLAELSAERGLTLAETMAVGDGANDLDMLQASGLGIAFHAKPIVAAAAKARIDHADLRALLFAQGYPASAFVIDA